MSQPETPINTTVDKHAQLYYVTRVDSSSSNSNNYVYQDNGTNRHIYLVAPVVQEKLAVSITFNLSDDIYSASRSTVEVSSAINHLSVTQIGKSTQILDVIVNANIVVETTGCTNIAIRANKPGFNVRVFNKSDNNFMVCLDGIYDNVIVSNVSEMESCTISVWNTVAKLNACGPAKYWIKPCNDNSKCMIGKIVGTNYTVCDQVATIR